MPLTTARPAADRSGAAAVRSRARRESVSSALHLSCPCFCADHITLIPRPSPHQLSLAAPTMTDTSNPPPTPPSAGYSGALHSYTDGLVAFDGSPDCSNTVIWIGGLWSSMGTTDGPGNVRALERYIRELGEGWGVVQCTLTSTGQGFGYSSIRKDAEEVALLVEYLVTQCGKSRVVLMGHSTVSRRALSAVLSPPTSARTDPPSPTCRAAKTSSPSFTSSRPPNSPACPPPPPPSSPAPSSSPPRPTGSTASPARPRQTLTASRSRPRAGSWMTSSHVRRWA